MTRLPDNLRTEYVPNSCWPAAHVAAPRMWLGADEQAELARLTDLQRRRQWLAGRWAGKRLICREMNGPESHESSHADHADLGSHDHLADIQIMTRDARGRGMRPRMTIGGCQLPWSLSISHSERGVLVALAATEECSLGVDLASKTAPSAAFQRLWFTLGERRWLAADPCRRTAVLWAMKEATYKAGQDGEGWSPRDVEIRALAANRFACIFRDRLLHPLWTDILEIDGQIAAIVCLPHAPEIGRMTGSRRQVALGTAAASHDAWTLCDGRTYRLDPPISY